jgi:hypothetical protein
METYNSCGLNVASLRPFGTGTSISRRVGGREKASHFTKVIWSKKSQEQIDFAFLSWQDRVILLIKFSVHHTAFMVIFLHRHSMEAHAEDQMRQESQFLKRFPKSGMAVIYNTDRLVEIFLKI